MPLRITSGMKANWEESKECWELENQRNLAVAYYDYEKAYDKVHHNWMLRVYSWMGIPVNVISLLKGVDEKVETRLEIWSNGKKNLSRWVKILCGFLQGDSCSPVGFCLTEVPVCRLIKNTRRYGMGNPGERRRKRAHSLFIDDLKVYHENHNGKKNLSRWVKILCGFLQGDSCSPVGFCLT